MRQHLSKRGVRARGRTSGLRLPIAVAVSTTLLAALGGLPRTHAEPIAGGTLGPADVPKYASQLVIPPAMPRTGKIKNKGGKNADYYELAVRQFDQQILPAGLPMTTVWSYGSLAAPGTAAQGGSFFYPAFTIEARWTKPVRVRWSNELVQDPANCNFLDPASTPDACAYLPHLLPVDQTLHWANPVGDCKDGSTGTDCRGTDPTSYAGPVPMIVHLHGGETPEWSDGYPEAWYLPNASNLDVEFESGSFYETFHGSAAATTGTWEPGTAVFEYPNNQDATTLWYHDHTLGMTRLNVYAGPAGFYLLRGGPGDAVLDAAGNPATLPGPAPALGDPAGLTYYEIPIVIQDRSFNDDGSLFYPAKRAFFEGLDPDQLQIPFIPSLARDNEPSDVSPIWQPEFFGNMMVTNGATWPVMDAEQRRYRLRFLNGTDSRFLILKLVAATNPDDATTWRDITGAMTQIGADQGFLPAPLAIDQMLLGPAERADMIVDFATVQLLVGEGLYLVNVAPDEPFGGGTPFFGCGDVGSPDDCFEPSDPSSTGQVMKFNLVPSKGRDTTTPAAELVLPAPAALGAETVTRTISLNELESETVFVTETEDGSVVFDPASDVPFGPTEARLGVLDADGNGVPLGWAGATTENPAVNTTEMWEIYNFTADAHPIHIHLIQFLVVDRQSLATDEEGVALQPAALEAGTTRAPEPWESGYKDTVIAYPGEVTRVKALFPLEGLYVWHCHILEHEDNEMMRPYCVGNTAACQQHNDNAGD